MGKQSGLGDQLYIAGVNTSGDIATIGSFSTPRETLPATGIDAEAAERMFGKRDAQAEFTTFFNKATGGTFDTLAALPTADAHVMYLRGQTLGNPGIGMVGKQIDYTPTRGDDGSLTFGCSVQSNAYGADWGVQLTAGTDTFASAGSGTSVDLGTGTVSHGFQAYLQVFSIASGTATVAIQSSSDDGGSDTYANITGGAFTAVTAAATQRIQSTSDTLAVEQYVRVNVTGTFTNLVCAVLFVRNDAARAL